MGVGEYEWWEQLLGGVYLRYPLVYARHRQLTLVLEGVFDELGVGERRFLRPACFAVVGSHVPRRERERVRVGWWSTSIGSA